MTKNCWTLEEINEALYDLVFVKSCEETLKIIDNMNFRNYLRLYNKFDNSEYTLKNAKISIYKYKEVFTKDFCDILTNNILDNFNYTYNEIYGLLAKPKKLKKLIIEEMIYMINNY